MSTHKDRKFKKFAITTRKRITPGITNAPTFAMQKKRARIYNVKGKRHWRSVNLGKLFKKKVRKETPSKVKGTKRNVGKHDPNTHRMHKKKRTVTGRRNTR